MSEMVAPAAQQAEAPKAAATAPRGAELREAEKAIKHWHIKSAQFGKPPPLMAFDLARMLNQDWAYRFLISADAVVENHAFLLYGTRFAEMLELPQLPVRDTPMIVQLPQRYRPVFATGCGDATSQQSPVRLNGIFEHETGEREMYRASFMPVAIRPNSLTQLVYGAFNRRLIRPAIVRA